MNKEERLTKSMLDMANGAIKERVDVEMPRIIKNIMDVNTNATKPRKMMLTLTFTPDEQRQVIATKCEIKSTLQPTNPVTTSLYIGEFAGEVQAVEMKPQVPGQMDMYGNEEEQPARLRLVEDLSLIHI